MNIDKPTVADFTNSIHDHTSNSGGGKINNTYLKNLPPDLSYTGTVITKTAAGAVSFGDIIYFNPAGQARKAIASTVASYPAAGIVISAAAAGSVAGILVKGTVQSASAWNWTIGGTIYLHTLTAGGITQIVPHNTDNAVQVLGVASPNADGIYFNPSPDYVTRT